MAGWGIQYTDLICFWALGKDSLARIIYFSLMQIIYVSKKVEPSDVVMILVYLIQEFCPNISRNLVWISQESCQDVTRIISDCSRIYPLYPFVIKYKGV